MNLLCWPKSSFGSSVKCYGKTRTKFLANPIFTKQKQTPRFCKQSYDYQRGNMGGGES